MRTLRRYLSLLFPLIALLIGIESIIVVTRTLSYYEDLVGKNYTIVLVSQKELKFESIKAQVPETTALLELETESILQDITKNFQSSARANLKNSLPFFYSLKLSQFPNQSKIRQIESKLKNFDSILRIESFSKTHNQTYRLLVLLKGCVLGLSAIIMLLSLLLMMKQIEVWRFEHSERMEIMTYFGTPAKMKNKPLYRLAWIDSMLATAIVMGATFIIANSTKISAITALLGIDIFNIKNFALDCLILAFSSYFISMVAVFVVILFQKEP